MEPTFGKCFSSDYHHNIFNDIIMIVYCSFIITTVNTVTKCQAANLRLTGSKPSLTHRPYQGCMVPPSKTLGQFRDDMRSYDVENIIKTM